MMTGPEREDEFEAYLRRRVRIDRRLRSLDRLEPPAELDQIIIGQARQAIQGAAPVPKFRGSGHPAPRWALPMGMAATILISLSVLLDLGVRDAIRKDAGRPAVLALVRAHAMPAEAAAPAPAPESAFPASTAPAAIKTAPWPPLPRTVKVEASASAGVAPAAEEAANASAASDSARSRVSEHVLATTRLRTADASASAEPMPASWQAEAQMAVVTVIGTRIHQ
jgi:hypothetical protein